MATLSYILFHKGKSIPMMICVFYYFFVGKFGNSKKRATFAPQLQNNCPDGGIGRRAGLKHQWSKIHPGSTPGLGTQDGC